MIIFQKQIKILTMYKNYEIYSIVINENMIIQILKTQFKKKFKLKNNYIIF
jgi:hypothetical protein